MAVADIIVPAFIATSDGIRYLPTRGYITAADTELGSVADDETGYYHRAPAGADVSFTRKSTDDVPYRRMGQDDGTFRRMP